MLLRPGVTCGEALKILDSITERGLNTVQNAVPHLNPSHGTQGIGVETAHLDPAVPRLQAAVREYDDWTAIAGAKLAGLSTDRSLASRLRGERYSHIVRTVVDINTVRHVAALLNTELQELRVFFMDLANEIRETQERYKGHQGRTLVLDTNDLLQYMRFDKIPWARLFGPGTVVVIPHVVVDEIDRKSHAQSETVKRRARGVFGLLEEVLTDLQAAGAYHLGDGTAIEVMVDPPGHVRQLNNDDEIVARACHLQQAVAPTKVTVITGDNGMRARAMAWSLPAARLDEKYKIKPITAEEHAQNLAAITGPPQSGDSPTPSGN